MKKQLPFLAGLLLASTSWAQTEKGNGLISGTISVDYSKTRNDYRSVTPELNVTAGRFLADNWLTGLSTRLRTTFEKRELLSYPNTSVQNRTVYASITPFVRRYWRFNPVHFFAGAGLSVNISGSRRSDFISNNSELVFFTNRSLSFTVSPYFEGGLNYLLTNRLGLQLTATTSSIPFYVAGVGAGLVYWTGAGRQANAESPRPNPQTDKGRWLLEGSFSAYNQTEQQYQPSQRTTVRTTSTTFSISPSVGFFVRKNSLLGISFPVSVGTSTIESGAQSATVWTLGVSPYYQRYWLSTRITPYTRVNVSYRTYRQTLSSGERERTNNFGAGLNVGLAYMAGQRFIVESSLGSVSLSYLTNANSYASWNTNITAGLTGNFAVRYAFK